MAGSFIQIDHVTITSRIRTRHVSSLKIMRYACSLELSSDQIIILLIIRSIMYVRTYVRTSCHACHVSSTSRAPEVGTSLSHMTTLTGKLSSSAV